jgi:hypothetical protein
MDRRQVGRHDVADVVLETRHPIAFDDITLGEATARFVLVDGFDIAGGGIIVSAERDNQEEFRAEARLRDFHWIKGGVTPKNEPHGSATGPRWSCSWANPAWANTGYAERSKQAFLRTATPHTCWMEQTCF